MPLKTVVKVGNISNLSDARYCAGMGVDMLGFAVMKGHENYITPQLFQEIRGWVSGPKVVAEIYGIQTVEELSSVIENYLPDYLELTDSEYKALSTQIHLPCLVSVHKDRIHEISLSQEKGGFLLLGSTDALPELDERAFLQPLMVKVFSNHKLLEILDRYDVGGIAINGSPEIRPGYKDYNELSEILEALEI